MKVINATTILFAVLLPGLFVHRFILMAQGVLLNTTDYLLGYGINFLMAAAIIVALLKLPERYKSSLGFFFMFGSFFKFIVYFVVFLPLYKADGNVSKAEFFLFFTPYLLSLIVETSVLIIKLNRED